MDEVKKESNFLKRNEKQNFHIAPEDEKIDEDELVRIRKEKLIKFLKKNNNWVVYIVLAVITYLAVKIRSSNLPGLRDITTGTWTLGPDLDPFLFLRWAKYIVENGTLFAVDKMRYVPLGFETKSELLFHPYLMAWFHKAASVFGSESVTQSAVLYPVFMFALTVIVFFFFARKIFIKRLGVRNANIIGLISAFFLSVMPALLPRTIAGIPEKESVAFLFLFLALYFFLASWQAKKNSHMYILAILAGAATAGMALIWGGFQFIFLTIAPSVFVAFFLDKMNKPRIFAYTIWIVTSFTLMIPFSSRYTIRTLTESVTTAISLIFLFIIFVHYLLFETKLKENLLLQKYRSIPPRVLSTIVSIILILLLSTILFGFSFLPDQISDVAENLVRPSNNRLLLTVAENRQPYFNEWSSSFGPFIIGIPIFFWLFFIGSIYLFYSITKVFLKKERVVLTFSYVFFLFALIFSRYKPDSTLNGTNTTSLVVYVGGFLFFLLVLGYYYQRHYKNNELEKFKKIHFSYIILFIFFFLSIVLARGLVRLIMVLVPSASIIVSYLVVASFNGAKKKNPGISKNIAYFFVGIIIVATIFSGYGFYNSIKEQAPSHVPSIYTNQWQLAMSWVRENTPQDAVFGHWWDYGYWLQSIGERATVLDGGNAIPYWNYLMGRYALTGSDDREALEFLYAHNTTHFLIDSTDIGKYGAFSSIGSDENFDRASFIPTFAKNPQGTRENKNSTIYFYQGGSALDEDIIFEENGTRIFLPAGIAGIGGVLIERNAEQEIVSNPIGIFFYQGQQYNIPLRYAYHQELVDFESGLEAGVYIYPVANQGGNGGLQIELDGAMFYLSPRTINSQVARLYLFNEDNLYFELIHSEDDLLITQIKNSNSDFPFDIVHYQVMRGPIRIWKIEYPDNIDFKEEFISTVYPEELK